MKHQPLVPLALTIGAVQANPLFGFAPDICIPSTVYTTVTVDPWVLQPTPRPWGPPDVISQWTKPAYSCGSDGYRLCPPSDWPVVYACGKDGVSKCGSGSFETIIYTCGSDGKQLCAPPDWTSPSYKCGDGKNQLCLPPPDPYCGNGYLGACCQIAPSPGPIVTVSAESLITLTLPESLSPTGGGGTGRGSGTVTTTTTTTSSGSLITTTTTTTASASTGGAGGGSASSGGSSGASGGSSGTSTTNPSSSSTRTTSSSSTAAPSFVCGVIGYDKSSPPAFFYDNSGTTGNYPGCNSLCAVTPGCQSFGYSATECALFNATMLNNIVPNGGSSLTFYDRGCEPPLTTTSATTTSTAPPAATTGPIDPNCVASATQRAPAPAGLTCGVQGFSGAIQLGIPTVTTSLEECALSCALDTRCRSISYNQGTCHFYTTAVGTNVNGATSVDTNYDIGCFTINTCGLSAQQVLRMLRLRRRN